MSKPDVNSLELLDTVVEVDESMNPEDFFIPTLPDDGKHQARLYLGDKGITVGQQRPKTEGGPAGPAYLNVPVVAKIIDPLTGTETLTVFDNPTSIVMQNGMSKLHALLGLVGQKAPGRATLAELKNHTEAVLESHPTVSIYTQWEAQIERSKGEYETLARGQKRFPPIFDTDGNATERFKPEIEDKKTGASVPARVRIQKYEAPE